MERVKYFPVTLTTGATGSSLTYIGKHDQLVLYTPVYTSVFGTTSTKVYIEASPSASQSSVTCYYFNYGSAVPASSVATISAQGAYEMPYAGGMGYVRIAFDTAVTNTTQVYLIAPSDSY